MPVLICLRKELWTGLISVGDQVPTCPVFTRAKIKSHFGILVQFAVTDLKWGLVRDILIFNLPSQVEKLSKSSWWRWVSKIRIVLVLDADRTSSCIVRNLETVEEVNAYVAEAGWSMFRFTLSLVNRRCMLMWPRSADDSSNRYVAQGLECMIWSASKETSLLQKKLVCSKRNWSATSLAVCCVVVSCVAERNLYFCLACNLIWPLESPNIFTQSGWPVLFSPNHIS